MLERYIDKYDAKAIRELADEYLQKYRTRISRAGNSSVKREEFYERRSPVDHDGIDYDSVVAGIVIYWSRDIQDRQNLQSGKYLINVGGNSISVTIVDETVTEDDDEINEYKSVVEDIRI